MKKCPECGNPSYDGAPVCGNCGYKFPKPKVKAHKEEDIFQNKPITKSEDEKSTIEIIKENKVVIGAILLITLIVIGIIVATGPSTDTTPVAVDDSNSYSDSYISFNYPSNWEETSGYDELHEGAVFFQGSNGTVLE